MDFRSVGLNVGKLGVTLYPYLLKFDKARAMKFGFQRDDRRIARQLNLDGLGKVGCMGLAAANHRR